MPDIDPEIAAIFERDGQDAADLRDRAAYIELMGGYPSHLRTPTMRLLVPMTVYQRVGIGHIAIREPYRAILNLDAHPMVAMVRRMQQDGFRTAVRMDRRPYGQINMSKRHQRAIVNIDGSVRLWDVAVPLAA